MTGGEAAGTRTSVAADGMLVVLVVVVLGGDVDAVVGGDVVVAGALEPGVADVSSGAASPQAARVGVKARRDTTSGVAAVCTALQIQRISHPIGCTWSTLVVYERRPILAVKSAANCWISDQSLER